jgi:pyridoxal phosphate enzyme (YggS family)
MMAGEQVGDIAENFHRVQEQIAQAAQSAGRQAEEVRLVVVTKAHSLQEVQQVVAAGARRLGENYVEEAVDKIRAVSDQDGVEWHMIGHVQSRKARPVCENFDWLHSLDRLKVAQRLDSFCGELGRCMSTLLECNVSGEESKFGLAAYREEAWPDLLKEVEQIAELPNIQLRGLMTMAPFLPDPEQARPYFRRLRRLRDFFARRFPELTWDELSMGMSADFQVAVQEGATLVRIGTAIMGPRRTA